MQPNILKENQAQHQPTLQYPVKTFTAQSKEVSSLLKVQPQQDLEPHPELSLQLHNPSLNLLAAKSIQRVIPIPRAMLSHSDDFNHPSQQQQPDQPQDLYYNHRIKVEVSQEEKEWFVQQLGLNQLLFLKRGSNNNTKNVLRNFGNAQTQFILHNAQARKHVEENLANPQKFYTWVRGLRLQKFDDFKTIWKKESNAAFRRVFRELCFKFYKESSVPYVLSSRMRSADTKISHLRYIFRFLEGLRNPDQFNYFRKAQR